MSRLLKAVTDLLQGPRGGAEKGEKSEYFSRSEFKRLIQQEFAPAKMSPSPKDRRVPRRSDPDTEPINRNRAPAKPCVY